MFIIVPVEIRIQDGVWILWEPKTYVYDNLLPGYVVAHLDMDGSSMVTCSPHYNSPFLIGCEHTWFVQDGEKIQMSRGCSYFHHKSWGSYEYLIHYQTEDSHEPRIIIIYCAHNPNLFYTHTFVVSVFGATLFHTPLKYVFRNKKSNSTRVVYLSLTLPLWFDPQSIPSCHIVIDTSGTIFSSVHLVAHKLQQLSMHSHCWSIRFLYAPPPPTLKDDHTCMCPLFTWVQAM